MLGHQFCVVAGLHFAVQGPVEVCQGLVFLNFLGSVTLVLLGVLGVHIDDLHSQFGMLIALANYHKTGIRLGADGVDFSVIAYRAGNVDPFSVVRSVSRSLSLVEGDHQGPI